MNQLTEREVDKSYEHCDVSSEWLYRFKSQFQIGRLTRHGHSRDVDESELSNNGASLAHQLESFSSENIYNTNESRLVFNKQPNSSNVRLAPNKTLKGAKGQKTCITTFYIVNQGGTDKRNLWIIRRAETPKAFRQNLINIVNRPVIYMFNQKALMLSRLWHEFLRSLNDEMRIQRRHIALFSDNCPSHPPLTNHLSTMLDHHPQFLPILHLFTFHHATEHIHSLSIWA